MFHGVTDFSVKNSPWGRQRVQKGGLLGTRCGLNRLTDSNLEHSSRIPCSQTPSRPPPDRYVCSDGRDARIPSLQLHFSELHVGF